MKTVVVALSLLLGLASAPAASDDFRADRPSPLKLVRQTADERIVHFTGTARLSGRFVAAWEVVARTPRYLRITFLPSEDSAALLPHAAGAGAVKELMLTNNQEAVGLLLGREAAGKMLAKEVLSAEGEASVTIGDYQTVVDCDHRWYMARLVAVAASRDVALAAGEGKRPAC